MSPPPLALWADPHVAGLREALGAPLRSLIPEPEGAIVRGIVLGERGSLPRELRTAFAVTGTTHILAISGFNMTLVAAATGVLLHGRVRPAVRAAAMVLSVAGYSVLVGPQPSVVRAALMASVGAVGLALGRRGAAANALGGAAAVMLLIDPRALEDVGFLMSVSATAGLIVWDAPLVRRLARLPTWAAEGLAATVAASLPTIPIVAAVFGRVSLVSPLANLVAVPLFAPIMAFGAATAAVGALLPDAAWPLAMAAFVSATAFRRAVEAAAAVPLAALSVPPGAPTGMLVAAALALAFAAAARFPWSLRAAFLAPLGPRMARALSLPRVGPRVSPRLLWGPPLARGRGLSGGAGAALCLAALAGGAFGTSALAQPPSFRVHALDIGQGDAFLIESAGRYALIDGGPDPGLALRQLGAVLPPWQRRIDLVALTHEHADHGAGLLGVIQHYEIGLAIEPVGMNDVPFVRMWSDALARARVARRAVGRGAVVHLGALTLRVLAPGERRVQVPSLAIRVSSASSSALFLGDSTDDAVADLLLSPGDLSARLFIPQHHGAESAYTAALVAAAHPEAALISVGAMNKYGHPTPSTLEALRGLPVYRTDRYGTVDVDLDAQPLVLHTAKAGLPPDRGGPVPSAAASR